MIRLAARVSIAGGRESLVRLVLTALGVALGVALLLLAAVAFPALHQHDLRAGWTNTSLHNKQPQQNEANTDPLLWRFRDDRFEGHAITRVDIAAEGANAPVPPGLTRVPGPGEIAASPAMARLLRDTSSALLADRYPGHVTMTVGKAALQSSDQLVLFVGYRPSALRAQGGAEEVRSIEAAPVTHSFSTFLRVVFVVGGLGLLVPVLVFVSTATRLAAARREQRLAAMRLAGATPRQASVVAVVEAAIAAVAGTLIGFAAFFFVRPDAARVPIDGYAFYPSDLRLAPGWALLVAFGVPVLAALAALASLRRVRISPLGVTRQERRSRPSAWRAVLLGIAVLFFALSLSVGGSSDGSNARIATIGTAFVSIIVGIVVCGPWLTALVARGMNAFGRRVPSLLAARRLGDNPSAGFRAISGLVLAVFVASFVSALAASATAAAPEIRLQMPSNAVIADAVAVPRDVTTNTVQPSGLPASEGAALLRKLNAIPGVRHVAVARALPPGVDVALPPGPGPKRGIVSRGASVATCTDAQWLQLDSCSGTTGVDVDVTIDHANLSLLPLTSSVAPDALAAQPIVAVSAFTDGRPATVEAVRTLIERAFPASSPATASDIFATRNWQVRDIERLSNIALLLTLLIAGCSLAVSVAGGLVERKRPFALLRLGGMPLRQLHRVVLAEAAAPLLVVAAASVALGLAVDAILLQAIGSSNSAFHLPTADYWFSLGTGLLVALVIVAATLPLLDRLTSLETARFE